MTNDTPAAADTPPFAGFWRRVVAACVDLLLLGAVGQLLGLLMFDTLVALGQAGQLVGLAIAWPYLGLLNSRLGRGQTPGKRLLGLRTVGRDGLLLTPAQGLRRAAVQCLPWFLNGLSLLPALPPGATSTLAMMAAGVLIGALGLGELYLLVFNRPSRRTLHDWAAGSSVIWGADTAAPAAAPLARVHRIVLGLLTLLMLALPPAVTPWLGQALAPVLALWQQLTPPAGTRVVNVTQGRNWTTSAGGGSHELHYLVVSIERSTAAADPAVLARQIARQVLDSGRPLDGVDQLGIVVRHGFDIGIASSWQDWRAWHSPAEWRAELGPVNTTAVGREGRPPAANQGAARSLH
ncbi:MAG: hypothetical protein DI603_15370 [Roseateles depolymerans]|uniref:RDD domain-containing protein n=1 Tax=Roseateles depolymerans TaxID=76731 RepID=A0A2W5FKY1_9BURK|nr:MAG: hypothetical protein DI603_15370 [Roseateles depolymerans]